MTQLNEPHEWIASNMWNKHTSAWLSVWMEAYNGCTDANGLHAWMNKLYTMIWAKTNYHDTQWIST